MPSEPATTVATVTTQTPPLTSIGLAALIHEQSLRAVHDQAMTGACRVQVTDTKAAGNHQTVACAYHSPTAAHNQLAAAETGCTRQHMRYHFSPGENVLHGVCSSMRTSCNPYHDKAESINSTDQYEMSHGLKMTIHSIWHATAAPPKAVLQSSCPRQGRVEKLCSGMLATVHQARHCCQCSYKLQGKRFSCARLCLCPTSSVHTIHTVHTTILSQKNRQCHGPLSWQHAAGRQITLRKLESNKREITESFGWRVQRDKEVNGT